MEGQDYSDRLRRRLEVISRPRPHAEQAAINHDGPAKFISLGHLANQPQEIVLCTARDNVHLMQVMFSGQEALLAAHGYSVQIRHPAKGCGYREAQNTVCIHVSIAMALNKK